MWAVGNGRGSRASSAASAGGQSMLESNWRGGDCDDCGADRLLALFALACDDGCCSSCCCWWWRFIFASTCVITTYAAVMRDAARYVLPRLQRYRAEVQLSMGLGQCQTIGEAQAAKISTSTSGTAVLCRPFVPAVRRAVASSYAADALPLLGADNKK